MRIVESHINYLHNVIHKIISLPKLSYKTNLSSGMPIVTKIMNQIGPCVYTRYNENMYKNIQYINHLIQIMKRVFR